MLSRNIFKYALYPGLKNHMCSLEKYPPDEKVKKSRESGIFVLAQKCG